MLLASIDLTPIVTALAALLQGTGPWGMLAGAVLLFVAQKFGGQKVNVSGFVSGLVKPATAQDKLIAELKQRLEQKLREKTSTTVATVTKPAESHIADEFLKWAQVIEQGK